MMIIPALRLLREISQIRPKGSVVGVCLEGDTTHRLNSTIALYQTGQINRVIVSGGQDDPSSDNLPASLMKNYLVKHGLPENVIDLEERSLTTHDHPEYVNRIAKNKGYTELLIITSGYHLLRAYLRFLKVLLVEGHSYGLYGYPAGSFGSWFRKSPTEQRYRILNFFDELTKIREYDDLASFDEAWKYLHRLKINDSNTTKS